MRFATFIHHGREQAGIYVNGGYYAFRDIMDDAPATLLEFICAHENKPLPQFRFNGPPIPAEEVRLCAPIPRPARDVLCLGKNYADHAKEIVETRLENQDADMIPTAPVYFGKRVWAAPGDGDTIPLHGHCTAKVDYEVELAVIIGRTTSRITPEAVASVVFGYTVLNYVTARDLQTRHGQWFFGKGLDGFCPMGPHLVSRDEMPFPVALDLSCRVNGELRQSSNTANLIFDIPRIVSELSQGMTLYPGDILATGTPAGIGHAQKPPRYLQPGDTVTCEIEGIGALTNYFA